jgi:hypothetical protein
VPIDVWTYFEQRERECSDLSVHPAGGSFDGMFTEEAGSDGRRGRIFGELELAANVRLSISETVVVGGNRIHRLEYAYYLIIEGVEVWGYERDLSHSPAEHRHVGPDHPTGEPWETVSFRQAVEFAWARCLPWSTAETLTCGRRRSPVLAGGPPCPLPGEGCLACLARV